MKNGKFLHEDGGEKTKNFCNIKNGDESRALSDSLQDNIKST